MNTLLIGGSGFIGSALSQALLNSGESVVSVSLSGAGDPSGVTSVKADLYHENCPPRLLAEADDVMILIGQVHADFRAETELKALKNLLEPLRKGKQRVTYFSSSFVYGNTATTATERTPCQPIGVYAEFKLAAEMLAQQLVPSQRLTILRLANIYGAPGNRGVIGILMKNITSDNLKIDLNGNGRQRRDYLFLDDLVEAVLAIKEKRQLSGIVNVATGQSYDLKSLVGLVSKLAKRPIAVTVKHNDISGVEPQDLVLDNARLRRVYGFNRFTPLKKGLTETLKRHEIIPYGKD